MREPMREFNPDRFRDDLLRFQEKTGVELGPRRVDIGGKPFPSMGNYFTRYGEVGSERSPDGTGMLFMLPHESGALSRVRISSVTPWRNTEGPNMSISTHLGGKRGELYGLETRHKHVTGPEDVLSRIDEHMGDLEGALHRGSKVLETESGVRDAIRNRELASHPTGTFDSAWEYIINNKRVRVEGVFDPRNDYRFTRKP